MLILWFASYRNICRIYLYTLIQRIFLQKPDFLIDVYVWLLLVLRLMT